MGNRPSVIIADSNEKFLVYLATLLGRMNFEVLPVRTAKEVYDLAKIVSPNLVVLDVGDDDSATEMVEQLHHDNLLSKTPVIMTSADETKAESCFAAGCSDFLTKPIDLTHLHVSLQKCLPNREGMRKHLRAPFNQKVLFQFAGLEVNCFAVTLSEGGIFLRTNKPLPTGSRVIVKIPDHTGATFVLNGTIIYSMGLLRGQFLIPPGIAVEFNTNDDEVMQRLGKEVCRLLIGDIVEEQEELLFRDLKGE